MQTSSLVVLPEAITQRLESEFGPNWATVDTELGCRLTGQAKPVVQCAPQSEAEVSAVQKVAAAERWSVSPVGNGTQMGGGNIPNLIDLVIRTTRLNRVVEYSPADLVVTVQPGMLWRDFQATLAEQGQMLPLDPVLSPDATVGGVVSTAASGPLRALYGSLRDMTIGLRVVYPDGRVIRTGGKVVKNVAGYDMTKLFVGSLGTLGTLTEVTFKLRPLPAHTELCLLSGGLEVVQRLAARWMHSNLVASRVEALYGDFPGMEKHGRWTLAVECAENEAAAQFQTRQLAKWAVETRANLAVLRGDEVKRFWQSYHETLLRPEFAVRYTAPPATILAISEELQQECAERGNPAHVSVGCSTGVGRIYMTGASLGAVHGLVKGLRSRLEPNGGAAVFERAPLALRRMLDSFGERTPAAALMCGIKTTIDPLNLMSPGRLPGGI